MTKDEAIALLRSGHFTGIRFTKRTTGEIRQMLCRSGVKKHLKGVGPTYNFEDHGLISVYDMQRQAYRCVPIEGIVGIKVKKRWKKVD